MLSRLALRLAAVDALAPAALAETGPWPTIAGPRVYDSRQDPLDVLDSAEARPIIVVYTDETRAEPYGSDTTRPDDVTVDLVCELMLALKGSVPVELPDGTTTIIGSVETPLMDREHEMLLDLLEATVRRRIEGRHDVDAATQSLRRVVKKIQQIASLPVRDETRTVRVAARSITFRCTIPADKWPPAAVNPIVATGLDRLPEPLRTVAQGLPEGSSGRLAAAQAAALIADPAALTRLELVHIDAGLGRLPPSTPDAAGQVVLTDTPIEPPGLAGQPLGLLLVLTRAA